MWTCTDRHAHTAQNRQEIIIISRLCQWRDNRLTEVRLNTQDSMQELPLVMSDWFGLCSLLQTRGTSKPMCDERERECKSWHSWRTPAGLIDIRKSERHGRAGTDERSINHAAARAMAVSVRYRVHDSVFSFPFIPLFPFSASPCLSCLWLFVSCMSRRNRFAGPLWSRCYDSFICLSHILLSAAVTPQDALN